MNAPTTANRLVYLKLTHPYTVHELDCPKVDQMFTKRDRVNPDPLPRRVPIRRDVPARQPALQDLHAGASPRGTRTRPRGERNEARAVQAARASRPLPAAGRTRSAPMGGRAAAGGSTRGAGTGWISSSGTATRTRSLARTVAGAPGKRPGPAYTRRRAVPRAPSTRSFAQLQAAASRCPRPNTSGRSATSSVAASPARPRSHGRPRRTRSSTNAYAPAPASLARSRSGPASTSATSATSTTSSAADDAAAARRRPRASRRRRRRPRTRPARRPSRPSRVPRDRSR